MYMLERGAGEFAKHSVVRCLHKQSDILSFEENLSNRFAVAGFHVNLLSIL